jgi:hypothetical protein
LIEGEVDAPSLEEFWKLRAKFIKREYPEAENSYVREVADELTKLTKLRADNEVFLWFEHDLFCQINMWFVFSLLDSGSAKNVSVVYPLLNDAPKITDNFGEISVAQATTSFERSVKLSAEDISLGRKLWEAYKTTDHEKLRQLGETKTGSFPFLREACALEIDRKENDRPKNALRKIVAAGVTDFREVFRRFLATEAAYGFGDSQVKRMLEQIG